METGTITPISDAEWQRLLDEYLDGGIQEPQKQEVRRHMGKFVSALAVITFGTLLLAGSMSRPRNMESVVIPPIAQQTTAVHVAPTMELLPTKLASPTTVPTVRPTMTKTPVPTIEASPTPRPEPSYILNGIDFSNQKMPITMTITLRSGEVFSFTVKPQVNRNDFTPAQQAAFERLTAAGRGTAEVYLDPQGHILLGVHSGTLWPNDVPHDEEAEELRRRLEGGSYESPQAISTTAEIEANLAAFSNAAVSVAQGDATASFTMPGMVYTNNTDTSIVRADLPQMYRRVAQQTGGDNSPLAPYLDTNSVLLWFCGRDSDVHNPNWFAATQYSGVIVAR